MLALSSVKAYGNTWGSYNLTRITTSPVFNNVIYTFGWPFGYWPGVDTLALGTVDGLWLDSPGVTSGQSVNYTISLRNGSSPGAVMMNFNANSGIASTAMLFEVSA